MLAKRKKQRKALHSNINPFLFDHKFEKELYAEAMRIIKKMRSKHVKKMAKKNEKS